MAVALTSLHSHQLVTSPLEPRIAASQRAWEKVAARIAEAHPGFERVGAPETVERKTGGWHITETMCTWTGFRSTLMPLCDTIKIVAPRDLVDREDLHAPGLGYLAIERTFGCEPVITLVKETVDGVELEYLRLEVAEPEGLNEVLERAGPDYPARFGPGSLR